MFKEVKQLHKEETGKYPFGADACGKIYEKECASIVDLLSYIDWLEYKIVELTKEKL